MFEGMEWRRDWMGLGGYRVVEYMSFSIIKRHSYLFTMNGCAWLAVVSQVIP